MNNLVKLFKKLKSENGQSIVEVAITIPILLLILCGIIDFGWVFTNKLTISNATREGARFGTTNILNNYSVEDVKIRVKNTLPSNIKDKVTITVTYTDPYNKRNGDVIVNIVFPLKVITPVAGVFVQNQTVNISASTTMKVE